LIEPGQALGPGQIYNSNRVLLCSWLQRLGCEVIDAGILPDDLTTTRARLGELKDVDLILSTGGVSVGEADFWALPCGKRVSWHCGNSPSNPANH
jgi:molybdopterin molybdotransferase